MRPPTQVRPTIQTTMVVPVEDFRKYGGNSRRSGEGHRRWLVLLCDRLSDRPSAGALLGTCSMVWDSTAQHDACVRWLAAGGAAAAGTVASDSD
jgi:hypothetical protein